MLREDKRVVDKLHVAVAGVLVLAWYVLLHGLLEGRRPPLRPLPDYAPTIAVIVGMFTSTLLWRQASVIGPLAHIFRLLRELALAAGGAALAYGFVAYTFKLDHLSRVYVYGGLLGGGLLSAAWYAAAYAWHLSRGRERRRVLLVGEPGSLAGVAERLRRRGLGIEVAGTVCLEADGLAGFARALDGTVVDYAFFSGYRRDPNLVESAMARCQERGVEVWFNMDFSREELALSRVDYLDETPVLVFSRRPWPGAAMLVKRALDVALSLLLLLLLSPLLLLIALAVRLSSPGPVLFRQPRIGLSGREFIVFKFRSMYADPPQSRTLRNELKGPAFKMRDDPRVTPLGRWMRRYSVDELPQLWNVLVGEMSLVGPRPPLPSEVERYKDWHRRRLSMRPGITGLWQVMGRNDIPDFNDWVKLDLRYLDSWNLWLDLKILMRTIPVVLKGTGV